MWGSARARGQKRTIQVHGENTVPVRQRQRLERRSDLDAGIADQDVDASECLYHAVDTVIELLLSGDIQREGERLSRCGGELRGDARCCIAVEVGDRSPAGR